MFMWTCHALVCLGISASGIRGSVGIGINAGIETDVGVGISMCSCIVATSAFGIGSSAAQSSTNGLYQQ